jgi:hypothetical protein
MHHDAQSTAAGSYRCRVSQNSLSPMLERERSSALLHVIPDCGHVRSDHLAHGLERLHKAICSLLQVFVLNVDDPQHVDELYTLR